MYSVEATATNYATENFWRGLYASMCGAITLGFFKSLARNHGKEFKLLLMINSSKHFQAIKLLLILNFEINLIKLTEIVITNYN